MRHDLNKLQIEQLIVHDVPHLGTGSGVVLSEVPAKLTRDVSNFFHEHLKSSLSNGGFAVDFKSNATSPVPKAVQDFLVPDASGSFVEVSQLIANHLASAQKHGTIPGGLLTIVHCKYESENAIGIVKLEREQGIMVRTDDVSGKLTLSVEHIKDLMLTQKTRVFKLGLFLQQGAGIAGYASDLQQPGSKKHIANYFLTGFLGCDYSESPSLVTRRTYEAIEGFINTAIEDPERQAKYMLSLVSELESTDKTFSVARFAKSYLETEDRDALRDAVKERGLSLGFQPKDTSLISSKLKAMRMDFASGITLRGPAEAFEKNVKVTQKGDRATVQITDQIKRMGSK